MNLVALLLRKGADGALLTDVSCVGARACEVIWSQFAPSLRVSQLKRTPLDLAREKSRASVVQVRNPATRTGLGAHPPPGHCAQLLTVAPAAARNGSAPHDCGLVSVVLPLDGAGKTMRAWLFISPRIEPVVADVLRIEVRLRGQCSSARRVAVCAGAGPAADRSALRVAGAGEAW
jgi:hypothetical protein